MKFLKITLFLLIFTVIVGCTSSATEEPEVVAVQPTAVSSETAVDTATPPPRSGDDATASDNQSSPPPRPEDSSEETSEVVEVVEEETTVDETETTQEETAVSTTTTTVKADVWADNWFAFYLGEELIKEDSVSITTERSFNSESFTFEASYPLVLNFVVKDFKENDTGLEYIGSDRQQMGDGGFIAQFTDTSTGVTIAVTDADWACTVIHEAPLDKSCDREANPVAGEGPCGFEAQEEPANWKSAAFDDSGWGETAVYTVDQVSPKDGYGQINWDANAELIWTSDLETDNTILCRMVVSAP